MLSFCTSISTGEYKYKMRVKASYKEQFSFYRCVPSKYRAKLSLFSTVLFIYSVLKGAPLL